MDDKAADFPLWRLFSEVNRSQRLFRLAFPQVMRDAQERRLKESSRVALFSPLRAGSKRLRNRAGNPS